MFRYIFIGKVLPERVDFSLTPHELDVITSTGLNFKIKLAIQRSQIFVEVISDNEIDDIYTIKNIIVDFVRKYTDTYGYLKGYGYDLEITYVILPDNQQLIFSVSIGEIEKDSDSRPKIEYGKIIELINNPENYSLGLSLTDLNLSIKYPKDTGVFCYRSIESIMQFFNKGDPADTESRKKAWNSLNENLRISNEWITYVREFALNPRHGSPKFPSGDERVKIMKHTWNVVDRFLIYLLNNKQPLDKSAYLEL